ncbi:hypothetical protein HAX54_050558 [Datura stramonium]|uniref:Uncharacterized protein n=1 Tax=Datura stramonium TaxID=4076 RepID=A0ABS8WLK8_DATST|nr:hypothetical protein [Datura stramonium]
MITGKCRWEGETGDKESKGQVAFPEWRPEHKPSSGMVKQGSGKHNQIRMKTLEKRKALRKMDKPGTQNGKGFQEKAHTMKQKGGAAAKLRRELHDAECQKCIQVLNVEDQRS